MNLPTTKPNDRDLAWYVRECEALQCINAALKKQANDEFDAVITRNMELERENAALRERLDSVQKSHFTLSKDNVALRELTSTLGAPNHINIPVEKWRELRADKERLDWLLTDDGGFWVNWMYDKDEWTPELKASRDAIDACRNGRIGRERR